MGEVENIERQLLTSRKLGFILTNHVRILMRTACPIGWLSRRLSL